MNYYTMSVKLILSTNDCGYIHKNLLKKDKLNELVRKYDKTYIQKPTDNVTITRHSFFQS